MPIRFDLSPFPVVMAYSPLPGEAPHMTRARTLCAAAESVLRLPQGVTLDEFEGYATGRYCALSDEAPAEVRLRVVGVVSGQGAKKNREYLGVSYVALDAAGRVVGWSEDLHSMSGTAQAGARAFWTAVNVGQDPPRPKSRAADCGRLSFVEGEGDALSVVALTPELRAEVARAAASMPAAPPQGRRARTSR